MHIAPCERTGVATMLGWAAAEGWNPGLHDADTFYSSDPQGFWLGQQDGVPIASLSAVQWNPQFAFVGLYIVVPQQRGQGHGFRLWQHVLALHQHRCVALDGVVAQQSNYARSGFHLAHRSLRWAGQAGQLPALDKPLPPLSQVDPVQVAELDALVSPADRPDYLSAWLHQPQAQSAACLDSEQKLTGLAMARPCQQGWKVGPLIAPHADQALQLLASCCAQLPAATPIFVDVPEPNSAANRMLEGLGFSLSFEVARMYTRPVRPHRLDLLFGITSFELG
jgi:GNAT superfamily N-acetyltransferase